MERIPLFPLTTTVADTLSGPQLAIAGCDLAALAAAHGTPLYLYDGATLADSVDQYRQVLAAYPGPTGITYAGKAFLCRDLAHRLAAAGLWLDCTGVGELHVATLAGVPAAQLLVHGVNKSDADLAAAVAQAGTIVVDNLAELRRLAALADPDRRLPALWLRYRPGTAVATHVHTQTGQQDSKFGLSRAEAATAAALCRRHGLPLRGLHFHQGSHFADPAPVVAAVADALALAAEIGLAGAGSGGAGDGGAGDGGEDGAAAWTLCPGGGLAVPYHESDLPGPDIGAAVGTLVAAVVAGCRRLGMPLPRLQLEPGRSLIARAGVALYRVGAVKEAGGRRWVLVDGGLADNPRPALYGARYTALPVQDPARPAAGPAWVGGPYCESGDILMQGVPLPAVAPGELLAVPVSGAYQLSMGSNYNGARRPAVLWLADGTATLIQARESVADLTRRDRQATPAAATGPVPFTKYEALGNDYLVLPPDLEMTPDQIRRLCHRQRGVGADGVLLPRSTAAGAPFAVRIFNPDGSEAETSGNGLRIYARHLWHLGAVGTAPFSVATPAGVSRCRVGPDGLITVAMGMATVTAAEALLDVDGEAVTACLVSLGNPHCVLFPATVTAAAARRLGPRLENHPRFPRRTNVQLAAVVDGQTLRLEIWERGAGYTLASGSSAAAAAVAGCRLGQVTSPVTVEMPGGALTVAVDAGDRVTITGPAVRVYAGVIVL